MNADLEETLQELGPGCRAVVERLRAGLAVDVGQRTTCDVQRPLSFVLRPLSYLTAALIALVIGLTVVFNSRTPAVERQRPGVALHPPRDYTLSVDEMIATQNPDGSWQSDFLTRHHAKALAGCPRADARIAYKKAMRNLRVRGVL